MRMVDRWLKRTLDVVVSACLLILLSPLLAVLALLVCAKLGSPILFRQARPGLHGKPFLLYKFRTMTNAVDASGRLLPDAERLTRFGLRLRRSTLDELPELLNVLKGDMSLVGPRPLLLRYLERYGPFERRRHEVRPGLTGWAVVHGRNAVGWDERLSLDVWYVDHATFWLDLRIIARTIVLVVSRRGVASEGHATMPEYMGPNGGRRST